MNIVDMSLNVKNSIQKFELHRHLSYLITRGLATASWSNQHNAVTYDHRLKELNDFLDETELRLQTFGNHDRNDLFLQSTVVVLRDGHSWEEILENSL